MRCLPACSSRVSRSLRRGPSRTATARERASSVSGGGAWQASEVVRRCDVRRSDRRCVAASARRRWVIKGHGFGHGVGMSQYGAYGYAKHGRDYRSILGPLLPAHPHRQAPDGPVRVLLGSGPGSVGFSKARKACGKRLHRRHGYDSSARARASSFGAGAAAGSPAAGAPRPPRAGHGIRIGGKGTYRGKLRVKASGGGSCVVNMVGLDDYVMGVVAERDALLVAPGRASRPGGGGALIRALRSTAGGGFDVYDDTRSQVYGGKGIETRAPTGPAGTRATGPPLPRARGHRLLLLELGRQTESVQFGVPGASPVRYLKSVKDPYDRISPDHTWTGPLLAGRDGVPALGACSRGRLRKIKVLKTRRLAADRQGQGRRLARQLEASPARRSRPGWA